MGKNKPVRNAYYYFVQEYKSKYPKRFDSFNEYFQAAGSPWSQMGPEQRRPYEEQARKEKTGTKTVKYTTSGFNIDYVERKEQEKEAKQQKMKDDIEDIINVAVNTGRIAEELFYIIHANTFCRYTDNLKYVPAELAVARFTLRDGVTSENVFHVIVEPGPLQVGYSCIARDTSEETHKLPPPASYKEEKDNMAAVFTGLKAFMKEMHPTGQLPPVYTEEKNIPIIENILDTLVYDYGAGSREGFNLRVYALDYFLYTLRNAVGSINGKQVWPQLSNSILQIEKDTYDFCQDVPCSFHGLSDAPNHCSRSHVMRFAYLICDNCCGDLFIELIPGKHVPKKANLSHSRTPSRPSSVASSYITARSIHGRSTLPDEDCFLSTAESAYSETSTLVDPDEFPGIAASLSYNESAHTDEDNWEQPKQKFKHRKDNFGAYQFQSQNSQESASSAHSQPNENRSRRPVTLSAGLSGLSLSGSVSPGIRSMVGRGRGRGFLDKI